ncbi:MAG: hypothetical protein P8Q26_03220 [Ascidiaceihabitans sp.]|nr:hypothetical protein [Ascidiaceihabitans sp.]
MNSFAAPVLYTPGARQRQNPVARINQANKGYRENARLSMNGVGFVTAHLASN